MATQVPLSEIEHVNPSDLSQSRLHTLQHGFSSFDDTLNSRSTPIALDGKSGKPYKIIDGRHRIYLARKLGYKAVPARFV